MNYLLNTSKMIICYMTNSTTIHRGHGHLQVCLNRLTQTICTNLKCFLRKIRNIPRLGEGHSTVS